MTSGRFRTWEWMALTYSPRMPRKNRFAPAKKNWATINVGKPGLARRHDIQRRDALLSREQPSVRKQWRRCLERRPALETVAPRRSHRPLAPQGGTGAGGQIDISRTRYNASMLLSLPSGSRA
jgi:hypothetical protein